MPLLVIVSGAPATGKTTLARTLAMDLRLPLVTNDDLKGAPADAADDPIDLPTSMRVCGDIAELLEAGAGLVLESNFRCGLSDTELRPLATLSDAALVHCTANAAVITTRYAERHLRGDPHAAQTRRRRSRRGTRRRPGGRPVRPAGPADPYDAGRHHRWLRASLRGYPRLRRITALGSAPITASTVAGRPFVREVLFGRTAAESGVLGVETLVRCQFDQSNCAGP
jgi:predicted kinase